MNKNINLLIIMLAAFLMVGFSCGNKNQDGDTIDDIQSAIKSNQKMKCTYIDNDIQSTSYFDGEKYRNEYTLDGIQFYSIFDGESVYTWNVESMEGNTFAIKCLGEEEEDGEGAEEYGAPTSDSAVYDEPDDSVSYQKADDIIDEHGDMQCTKVSSVDLSIPSDVDFYDQCEDLQKMLGIDSDTDPAYDKASDE